MNAILSIAFVLAYFLVHAMMTTVSLVVTPFCARGALFGLCNGADCVVEGLGCSGFQFRGDAFCSWVCSRMILSWSSTMP